MELYSKIPFNMSLKNPIVDYIEVKDSNIHGLGCFAKKRIPKGTIWWYPRPCDIKIFTKDDILTLFNSTRNDMIDNLIDTILHYSYYDTWLDVLVLCLDNARYVNHSENDNSGQNEEGHNFASIALKDIEIGEEITENYKKYTPCEWIRLYCDNFDFHCW